MSPSLTTRASSESQPVPLQVPRNSQTDVAEPRFDSSVGRGAFVVAIGVGKVIKGKLPHEDWQMDSPLTVIDRLG